MRNILSNLLIIFALIVYFISFHAQQSFAQVCTTTAPGTCLNGGTCYMGTQQTLASYQSCNACPAGYTGESTVCHAQLNHAAGMCCIRNNQPTPTTPPQASCPSSNQICDTSNLRGQPGAACSASGYVYSSVIKDNRPTIISCKVGNNLGLCCNPAPANNTPYTQGTCSYGDICYTGDYNTDHLVTGAQCGTLKDWHFGTDGKGNVAMCGLSAPCCDPGPGTVNFTYQQPCVKDKNGNCTSVNTAFGDIPINVTSAISAIFAVLLSFSGGIVLLIIIFAGYRIMTSGGDQEKLKGAREMLTAGIIGLLFIIFSVTILRIIGVDILHIPGFAFK